MSPGGAADTYVLAGEYTQEGFEYLVEPNGKEQ